MDSSNEKEPKNYYRIVMIFLFSCLALTLILGAIYDPFLREGVIKFVLLLAAFIALYFLIKLIVKVFKIKGPDRYKWEKQIIPDRPMKFGRRTTWMEVREQPIEKIISALQLKNVEPCNWEKGIEFTKPHIFISQPVKGWNIIIGITSQIIDDKSIRDKLGSYLLKLSQELGEINYFAMYGFIDYYAWVKVNNGIIKRAFVWAENGKLWDEGEPVTEKEIGFKENRHPNNEYIMKMASKWCIAPWELDPNDAEPSLGVIGYVE